jgi:meiotic recombination protein DMC1
MDPDAALQNISYARCVDAEVSGIAAEINYSPKQTQQSLIENLAEYFMTGEYRLLIIDSVIALFKVDYVGRGELAERQQALGKFLHVCNKYVTGRTFSHTCLCSNMMQSSTFASFWYISPIT